MYQVKRQLKLFKIKHKQEENMHLWCKLCHRSYNLILSVENVQHVFRNVQDNTYFMTLYQNGNCHFRDTEIDMRGC